MADWGGHPLLYQIDLFDESGGQVSQDFGSRDHGSIDQYRPALPVTAGTWRLVLQNTEAGFGTTDLTATISWP